MKIMRLEVLKDIGEEVASLEESMTRLQLSLGYFLFSLRAYLRNVKEKEIDLNSYIDQLRKELIEHGETLKLEKFRSLSNKCVDIMLNTNMNPLLINYWIAGAKSLETMWETCFPGILRTLSDSKDIKELEESMEYSTYTITLANHFVDAFGDCIFNVMDLMSKGIPIEEIGVGKENIEVFDEFILGIKGCKEKFR